MKKTRNSPSLATEKLDDNTLVPFQVVSPVLPGCLHLYKFAVSSLLHHFHIILFHIHFIIVLKHCLYLHFVFPILFRLLAWPLHSDYERFGDYWCILWFLVFPLLPGPLKWLPRLPWEGAHSCLRGHIWLVPYALLSRIRQMSQLWAFCCCEILECAPWKF